MSVYAKEYGYFYNSQGGDRTYSADSFESWMKPFFRSGVFQGALQVTAQAEPDMTVSVAPGFAYLDGKPAYWQTASVLTLDNPSGVYDRIDTIVLRRDDTNRAISLEVVKGTASASPEPTPPTRNADVFELVIAQILVGVGVTGVRAEDITDTRMDSTVCGYVAGAVDQIDFDQIKTQFDAWAEEVREDFEAWFENIRDQLDEDAAGHLQNEIDALNTAVSRKVSKSGDTMTGSLNINGNNAIIATHIKRIDATTPFEYNYREESINVMDKNTAKMASIGGQLNMDGKYGAYFGASRSVGGVSYDNIISLLMDNSGNAKVEISDRLAWLDALGLGNIRIIPCRLAANGGTQSFVFYDTCAFTIFTTGSNSTQRSHTHGYCTGGGVVDVTKNPSGATAATFTPDNWKLTIKNTANVIMYAVLIAYGNPDNVSLQA